jgi:hypothetical protein
MVALGKTTRAGFVWLTALLTLVAGLPRVECHCPSGRIKPFCLGFLFPGGCCAAEASSSPSGCCAPADEGRSGEDVPSCCCHASSASAKDTTHETGIAAGRCTRTLTGPDGLVTATREAAPTVVLACLDFLFPGAPTTIPSENQGRPSRQGHSLAPPPTDLVTVLQRLTV